MNFEPQKFFIGLLDFFSILLPGMFVTYLGMELIAKLPDSAILFPAVRETGWAVFLFISYFSGHFVFLIGSILDDLVYGRLRSATDWGQVAELARGNDLGGMRLRALAKWKFLFGKNADATIIQAERIKARSLLWLADGNIINTFQWCKARLALEDPDGLALVQRFEADSKFFRSFVVALLIFAAIYLIYAIVAALFGWGGSWWVRVPICAILAVLALWRYVEQRFKSTQQAYWLIIAKEGLKGLPASPSTPVRPDGLTHAGGVVIKNGASGVRYLLIQAARNPDEWVLPKGHIEAGERPEVTAVREVCEETGLWAKVRENIGDWTFESSDNRSRVRFFLMEALEEARPEETRAKNWFDLDTAVSKATFESSRELLKKADACRSGPSQKRTPS